LSPGSRRAHLFLELRAAIEGLRAWVAEPRHAGRKVTRVVDNAAAAFALRHGFSSNNKATAIIQEAAYVLERVEDIILAISGDNPADCCSRNRPERWRAGVYDHASHRALLGQRRSRVGSPSAEGPTLCLVPSPWMELGE
jgi:hypothetical protein